MSDTKNIDVAVIGMGAAGSMAAITAAAAGKKVAIFDSNEKPGKKLYITGKGRCNLTNNMQMPDFMDNFLRNGSFLYSALANFDNFDTMRFFEDRGLKLKVERGGRVFPLSDHASDVIIILENEMKKLNVDLHYNSSLIDLSTLKTDNVDKNAEADFLLTFSNDKKYIANKLILACGGMSYPSTGSTGDGYKFAEKMGHNIIKVRPSLVPFILSDNFIKDMEGLSLKNVELKAKVKSTESKTSKASGPKRKKANKRKKEDAYTLFGEMIFTHSGISGPIVLSLSSYICDIEPRRIELTLDWKPALNREKLQARMIREREEGPNRKIKNLFQAFLPNKAIDVFLKAGNWDQDLPFNQFTKKDTDAFIDLLKNFPLSFKEFAPFSQAIVSRGGVDVNEINPSSMESKLIKKLYFCGEMLDCDGLTGGYNLQIAWSTGYLAGLSAGNEEI